MSPDDVSPADTPRRYAAALPWIARVRLHDDERLQLRRRLDAMWRRSFGATASVLAIAGVGAPLAATQLPALSQHLGGTAGLALALVGLCGVIAWAIAARRWVRWALASVAALTCVCSLVAPELLATPWLRTPWALVVLAGCGVLALAAWQRARVLVRLPKIFADIAAGELDLYEGPAMPENHALRSVLGRVPPTRTLRLEVLPRAQLVVGIDGVWCERWQLAHVAEVAAARPHAYRTALPAGVVRVAPSGARLELRRRSLSPDERAEITAHVVRLRRAAWPALAAAFAVVVVLGVRMSFEPDWRNLVDAVALGWYVLAAIAYLGYARRISAARKLESDRDLRWVVTVDDPHDRSTVPTEAAPRLEVLPISHLAWTENASPAAWRLGRL